MNLGMDMKALATLWQDIFDLLILLMQSIFYGKFDGAIDSSDGPAAFLGGIGESAYGHRGSGNYIANIFDLLILLMQSIFMVSLMVQSIVLMVLHHF